MRRPFGLAPRNLRELQPRLRNRKKHAAVVPGGRLLGQLETSVGIFPVISYGCIHAPPAILLIRALFALQIWRN
ncbi:MAG: hypothetical protein JO220_02865 [Hyphomicrobiales bacterium]|nr:hypothetical protein [Hyphomicrobiales bacterium]